MSLLSLSQFASFLGAAVLVTLSPGPDNLMVLSLGAARGRLSGTAFGLGCATGCLSHTLLAVLGISALIRASPPAFTALRLLGGLYLLWLGIQALRSRGGVRLDAQTGRPAETPLRLFGRGLLANAINPKVVMFFLAFLPQFVDGRRPDVAWQIAQLGLTFTLQSALLFGLLGAFAGLIGEWLAGHARVGPWLDRMAGTVFVLLGLRLLSDS